MRLIDADELISFYFDGVDESNQHHKLSIEFVPKEFIDNAPTVEAIPIEFIQLVLMKNLDYERCESLIQTLVEEWRKHVKGRNDKR